MSNKTFISNRDFERAKANTDNANIIKSIIVSFSKDVDESTLEACGDIGLWKCLKSHDPTKGNKFTSSLYRYVTWECLNALSEHRKMLTNFDADKCYYENSFDVVVFNDILDSLSQKEKRVLLSRFLEKKTLREIGEEEGCSQYKVKKILQKTIEKITENFGV